MRISGHYRERAFERARRSIALAALALLGWGGSQGCAFDEREVQLVELGALEPQGMLGAGAPAPSVPQPAGAGLGTACNVAADCASGFCVDGVCCDVGCADVCASCNAPGTEGTCSPIPSDPLCSALLCPQGTECRGLDATQAISNCEGLGACRRSATCQVTNFEAGASCENGTGSCDGNGACAVAGKLILASECATDDQCAEGHCATTDAGTMCCDTPCDGECQQCSSSGHCEATPSSDPRCPTVTCPADNVCRDYGENLTGACRSFGVCAAATDCAYAELRPAADCNCDAQGNCTLLRGRDCSSDENCASGACVPALGDGRFVCCAERCSDGLSCSSDGSACVECAGSQVSCDGLTELRCQADGLFARTECPFGCTPGEGCNLLPGLGLGCDAATGCAMGLVCQQDGSAVQRCCARDCGAEGRVCAENGSCVCPPDQFAAGDACLLRVGDACQQASDCESGNCVDGVCCQEACGGACEQCQPGTGACVAVAAGQQDNACNGSRECVGGRGDCRSRLRESCAGNADCASSNCEPSLAGGQRCCADACTGDASCSTDGTRCVQCEANAASSCGNGCNAQTSTCNPLRTIGSTCALPQQCAAPGQCLIDNTNVSRCCEANCGAQGKVCNAGGRCVCPPNQTDVNGQCRTRQGQPCSDNPSCVTNACELAVGGGNRCCVAECNANSLCAADGSACIDQRGAVGARCTTGADCQNGNCVNNVCCSGSCGACQRCQQGTGVCQADSSAACSLAGGVPGDCNERGQCVDPGVGPGQRCGARPCQPGLVCTADGVCCNSQCNGACESACSNGSGACNMPATDSRCGQTQCSAPQCQTSRALQNNRSCVGPGVCASPAADQCAAPTGTSGGSCALRGGGTGQCANGVCNPVLAVAGAACSVGTQCASGVCTGGFCCAGNCSGLCAACQQNTGACVAPADDINCRDVTCSGQCKVAQTLTTGMCRGVNQCKTTLDCPVLRNVDNGNRLACGPAGSHQVCINGNCSLPTVLCNGVNQQVTGTSACCEIIDTAGRVSESFSTLASCPSSGLDTGGLTTTPITCDSTADCPQGESCCLRSAGDSAIECTAEALCVAVRRTQYLVCSSPQGVAATCPAGDSCEPFFLGGFVPGWGFCN